MYKQVRMEEFLFRDFLFNCLFILNLYFVIILSFLAIHINFYKPVEFGQIFNFLEAPNFRMLQISTINICIYAFPQIKGNFLKTYTSLATESIYKVNIQGHTHSNASN